MKNIAEKNHTTKNGEAKHTAQHTTKKNPHKLLASHEPTDYYYE